MKPNGLQLIMDIILRTRIIGGTALPATRKS